MIRETFQCGPAVLAWLRAQPKPTTAYDFMPHSLPPLFGLPVIQCEEWHPLSWAMVGSSGEIVDCGMLDPTTIEDMHAARWTRT